MENTLIEIINQNATCEPRRLFSRKQASTEEIKSHRLLNMKLSSLATQWDAHVFALKCLKISDAVIYKFGKSYKRHTFFRKFRNAISLTRRLSQQKFHSHLKDILKGLNACQFQYQIEDQAICVLSSKIIQRYLSLDKIRLLCAECIEKAAGYIELKHNLNLAMLISAIAADLASEALAELNILETMYDELVPWFQKCDGRFPNRLRVLPLRSCVLNNHANPAQMKSNLDNVVYITALLSKPIEEISELSEDSGVQRIRKILKRELLELNVKEENDAQFYRHASNDKIKKKRRKGH